MTIEKVMKRIGEEAKDIRKYADQGDIKAQSVIDLYGMYVSEPTHACLALDLIAAFTDYRENGTIE